MCIRDSLNAAGGGALGYGISQTITWGFKRGAFSNEAGLGSAVMVNSASNVNEPVHQGMWGVFEGFADTIGVCTQMCIRDSHRPAHRPAFAGRTARPAAGQCSPGRR